MTNPTITVLRRCDTCSSRAECDILLNEWEETGNYLGGRILEPMHGFDSWHLETFYADDAGIPDEELHACGLMRYQAPLAHLGQLGITRVTASLPEYPTSGN